MFYNMRKSKFFFFILIGLHLGFAQTPERFINHRVKKGETLIQISEIYKVSQDQILEYNPFLQNNSIRRRMNLQVPVYIQNNSSKNISIIPNKEELNIHVVKPKETKWRLAYVYKMTIEELDSLNPQIINGLKIGQEIRVRNSEFRKELPEKDTEYNYYKVQKSEGYYRIKKKLGISRNILDSLNPILSEIGLQVGMILK